MLPSISRRCQGKVFRWGRGQQTPMERKKLHHLHSQSCERGVCQHSEELVGERQQGWRENNFKQQFCRCQLQHAGYIGKSSAGNKLLMNLQLAQITLLNLVLAARQATHGFHAPNTREESTQSLFHVFTLRNCSELTAPWPTPPCLLCSQLPCEGSVGSLCWVPMAWGLLPVPRMAAGQELAGLVR